MIRDNPKKFRLRRYFLANRFKKVNSDPVLNVTQKKETRVLNRRS